MCLPVDELASNCIAFSLHTNVLPETKKNVYFGFECQNYKQSYMFVTLNLDNFSISSYQRHSLQEGVLEKSFLDLKETFVQV